MTLEHWLDDLCVRFIINLPQEDLMSIARICFQVEEAHWFYEDFIRVLDPSLPHMALKEFCLRMFQHCPLLAGFGPEQHLQAYQEFMQYKTRIPVRGAIMLNHAMDSTVLVRGWKNNASWSFPRGKINKDEDDLDCAVREVYEETGLDIHKAGLVPEDRNVKFIEVTMRDQHVRLYVFRDVPMDTVFEPKTRNEIGKISWYNLQDLPAFRKKKGGKHDGNGANVVPNANKFYMVAPFLVPLKKWVVEQKKQDAQRAARYGDHLAPVALQDDVFTDDNGDGLEQPQPRLPVQQFVPDQYGAAEQELRNLLKVEQFIQGQQPVPVPEVASLNNQGAALLSMLQSKEPAGNHTGAPPAPNHYPHTPLEHITAQAQQPQSPHYHHANQRLPQDGLQNPPQFPIAPNTSYHAHPQHQPRPHVEVPIDVNGQPNYAVAPHLHQQNLPQLLHPQPQPPQVQQALLMRGMLGTPTMQDQPSAHPAPAQGRQKLAQHPQMNSMAAPGAASGPGVMPQPTAHSMGLLNMFKGNPAPAHTPQEANQSKPLQPIDKHRSDLLGMFKQADGGKLGNTDDRNAPLPPPHQSTASVPKPPAEQMSTADTLRTAAEENGRPVMVNPELNLPFGALSIASRPKQGPSSPKASKNFGPASPRRGMVHSGQTNQNYGRYSPKYTPSNLNKMESASQSSELPFSQPASQQPVQPSPQAAQSLGYPYGSGFNKGVSASDMSISRVPDASALPLPNLLKPRQEASSEQKSQLLSLFGMNSKGKEPAGAAADMPRPRSRVASIASGADGSASSRRGSQGTPTQLSHSDQDFLINYLRRASNTTAR